MKIGLVIPWRHTDSRYPLFLKVIEWYERWPHKVSVFTVDTDDPVFNLAACRNKGVRFAEEAGCDVVILNDADTIPESEPLHQSTLCTKYGAVVSPYSHYRMLTEAGTADYLSGIPPLECDALTIPGANSGVYVTTPETWWGSNGQDERFSGWGPEDAAFLMAQDTLVAPRWRVQGHVHALHHEPADKDYSSPHWELLTRYEEASGDVVAMSELVNES